MIGNTHDLWCVFIPSPSSLRFPLLVLFCSLFSLPSVSHTIVFSSLSYLKFLLHRFLRCTVSPRHSQFPTFHRGLVTIHPRRTEKTRSNLRFRCSFICLPSLPSLLYLYCLCLLRQEGKCRFKEIVLPSSTSE